MIVPRINFLPQEFRQLPTLHPNHFQAPVIVRFLINTNKFGPLWNGTHCWDWTALLNNAGYGIIRANRKQRGAHKWYWEYLHGEVPDGLELDHLCRRRVCVNPGHLEPVPHQENCLRGVGCVAINARKTHCLRGHPLSGNNLQFSVNHPTHRICRTCSNARSLARFRNNREEINRKRRLTRKSRAKKVEVK